MMAEEESADTDDVKAAREIARMISEYRQEVMDRFRQDVEDEADEVVRSGFDPARGRGRGPMWAEGG